MDPGFLLAHRKIGRYEDGIRSDQSLDVEGKMCSCPQIPLATDTILFLWGFDQMSDSLGLDPLLWWLHLQLGVIEEGKNGGRRKGETLTLPDPCVKRGKFLPLSQNL